MAEHRRTGKLAVILHADVAGSTGLVCQDEQLAHERIQDTFRRFGDTITKYHGSVRELRGDALLAEFERASDAVTAALAFQDNQHEYLSNLNDPIQPAVRVGIALGEVIIADDTITGEGVVLAQRLEQLSEPGAVVIQGSAYEAIPGRFPFEYDNLGEHEVKGFDEPVKVYGARLKRGTDLPQPSPIMHRTRNTIVVVASVTIIVIGIALIWFKPWEPRMEPASGERMAFPLPDKPSIVVLPFDNLSDDANQSYFADGITEDLTTDLSKISELFVISRNSAFTYKGKAVKPQQVAHELGVRYILEGSVRRAGDTLRVNAQLIDTIHGGHLWADRFDGSQDNIFEFQDKVIGEIVSALEVKLPTDDPVVQQTTQTDEPQAYDSLLQGYEHFRQGSKEDIVTSIQYFQSAVALDPEYSRAYAALAEAYWYLTDKGWSDVLGQKWADTFNQAERYLATALETPNSDSYRVSAQLKLYHDEYEQALKAIDQAISIAPSDSKNYVTKAQTLIYAGQPEASEINARLAIRLDPHSGPEPLRALGRALFYQGRYEAAVEVLEGAVASQPNDEHNYITLASAYGQLGQIEKGKAIVRKYNEIMTEWEYLPMTVQEVGSWQEDTMLFKNASFVEPMLEGLRKIGVPEGAAPQTAEFDFKSLVLGKAGTYEVKGATRIDVATAKLFHDRGVRFIDVRDPINYRNGHVPGAVNIDLTHRLTEQALLEVGDKDDEIVFYCWGVKCSYSALSCAKAVLWDFDRAHYFAGGFPGWRDAGYPVEKSDTGS